MRYVTIVCPQNLQIEINISFDLTGPTTLDNVGAKTVTITGTGASARCTVLLKVTLTDEKLPPLIIF